MSAKQITMTHHSERMRRISILLFKKMLTVKPGSQLRRLSCSVQKLSSSQLWKFPGRPWLVNDTMIVTTNQNTIKGTQHEAVNPV